MYGKIPPVNPSTPPVMTNSCAVYALHATRVETGRLIVDTGLPSVVTAPIGLPDSVTVYAKKRLLNYWELTIIAENTRYGRCTIVWTPVITGKTEQPAAPSDVVKTELESSLLLPVRNSIVGVPGTCAHSGRD